MKKLLVTIVCTGFGMSAFAQDTKAEFDNKFRFGLRITPQPTWFVSGNEKNNTPSGAVFGFGFGLNLEYWFSNKVCLLTGIGGDFEGGKYKFRHDADYEAVYWLNDADEVIEKPNASTANNKNTAYVLDERRVKVTYATIPVQLKLSTQEYSGIKYFGVFGTDISYRVNAKVKDTYYESYKFRNDTLILTNSPEAVEDINISPQTWFMRITLNAGAGMEYRIAGSTSVFLSVNYFRNLTNLMKKNAEYMYYDVDGTTNKYIKSQLFLTGIRFNVGIMF
jgi:hypothetical protein